jgi:hypothetical protein
MLTRRLYITKISQTVCLLWYVNPKVVPHQYQLSIVFIWDMLTCRGTTFGSTYLNEKHGWLILVMYSIRINISQWRPCLTYFGEVQTSGQHIPMNTMFDWFWWGTAMVFIEICWPEGCTSSKSINHGSHSGILTRRLYITKIISALCSLEYVDPKVVPHQNQSNIVFIGICWPEG